MGLINFILGRFCSESRDDESKSTTLEYGRVGPDLVRVHVVDRATSRRNGHNVLVRVATAGTYDRSAAFYDLRTYKGEPVF